MPYFFPTYTHTDTRTPTYTAVPTQHHLPSLTMLFSSGPLSHSTQLNSILPRRSWHNDRKTVSTGPPNRFPLERENNKRRVSKDDIISDSDVSSGFKVEYSIAVTTTVIWQVLAETFLENFCESLKKCLQLTRVWGLQGGLAALGAGLLPVRLAAG